MTGNKANANHGQVERGREPEIGKAHRDFQGTLQESLGWLFPHWLHDVASTRMASVQFVSMTYAIQRHSFRAPAAANAWLRDIMTKCRSPTTSNSHCSITQVMAHSDHESRYGICLCSRTGRATLAGTTTMWICPCRTGVGMAL